MKNLLLIVILTLTITKINAQCPDEKSNEYKKKAEQYGDPSYTTLATYYYYKCQCENGIAGRTAEQVNSLVDQYNTLKANKASSVNGISLPNQHQVQWVNITKVNKCSKTNNISNNNQNNKFDLSSKKRKAIGAAVGTAAIMATQAKRFGLGMDINYGGDFLSFAPVLYFMFDNKQGMNISYGIDGNEPLNSNSTRDAYDVKIGYVYDWIGIDLMYAEFAENSQRESPYRSSEYLGNQINLGLSVHLAFLKIGYSFPISSEGSRTFLDNREVIPYEASGIFTFGGYIYF